MAKCHGRAVLLRAPGPVVLVLLSGCLGCTLVPGRDYGSDSRHGWVVKGPTSPAACCNACAANASCDAAVWVPARVVDSREWDTSFCNSCI